jgi:biopolymer transport protein ExbD
MKSSRRIKRMDKARKRSKFVTKMNLTSLMDVFTILVFFLLVNSGAADPLESPKDVTLPESRAESKPKETVVIYVSPETVVVQGQPVAMVADILAAPREDVAAIRDRLAAIKGQIIGPNTQQVAGSQEVTIMADKSIPFSVVKQIMSTCTSEGYGNISLAVVQKDAQVAAI